MHQPPATPVATTVIPRSRVPCTPSVISFHAPGCLGLGSQSLEQQAPPCSIVSLRLFMSIFASFRCAVFARRPDGLHPIQRKIPPKVAGILVSTPAPPPLSQLAMGNSLPFLHSSFCLLPSPITAPHPIKPPPAIRRLQVHKLELPSRDFRQAHHRRPVAQRLAMVGSVRERPGDRDRQSESTGSYKKQRSSQDSNPQTAIPHTSAGNSVGGLTGGTSGLHHL